MKINYQDKLLRIIGYPVLGFIVRHFGEYESVGSLMKQPLYYGDLAWNTLLVALSWEANRRLIVYLDQHYSWVNQRFQRFVIQASTSFVITVPLVASMIYLWNEILIKRPGNFETGYLLVYDFPLTIVFTVLVHMIYTGMYFHQYYSQTIERLENRVRELETSVAGVKSSSDLIKPSGYRDLLIVNYGTASVPVQTNDIAFIHKQNEISFIKTFDGKEYTSSSSLENLEDLLDPIAFFRINRQMLSNVKAIRQFKADTAGKLVLEIQPSFHEEVTVSKRKAVEFKAWIGKKI
ncbi:MAG: LytTR family transcriptional regulator DNA-binding domain-containing protein [Cyclobacteriaceae bacterium]|nr:LytTR family transcriptional regulator DNA-binding domain-containing protein [Cyclobacteriaceae bacterium]